MDRGRREAEPRARRLRAWAVPVLALGAVACNRAAPPMLHEREAFAGPVRVELEEAEGAPLRIEGELAFDRRVGQVQLQCTVDSVARSVVRLPSGEVRAFVDGVPAAAEAEDRAAFDVVLRLVEEGPPADAEVEALADGYRIHAPGREITVRLRPRADPHTVR